MKFVKYFLLACLLFVLPTTAGESRGLSDGQLLYVPVYSHIYTGDRESPFLLTVTLSIRNIDPQKPIKITGVDYYESGGKLIKHYLSDSLIIRPMESIRYVIGENDKSGGSGANFLVEWQSAEPANPPIVESIMIGTQGQQGISFTSAARAIIRAK